MKNRESVVNSHSMGIFKASNWKKERDGLLLAAKALRQQWLSNREEVIKVITYRSPRSSEVFTKDSALARSSMLLLGYSVEMFLKSGVVKLHSYCPEEMVERLVRNLGHGYESMAKLLGVKLDPNQFEQLNGLSKSVVNDARYPATPSLRKDFFEQTNQITRYNHRQPNFELLVGLVEQIRDFARKIDSDSSNPTYFQHHWTNWGYVVARWGVICLLPSYLETKINWQSLICAVQLKQWSHYLQSLIVIGSTRTEVKVRTVDASRGACRREWLEKRADVEVGAKNRLPVMVLLLRPIHGRGAMMKAAGVRGSHVSFQPSAGCQWQMGWLNDVFRRTPLQSPSASNSE